MAKLFPLISHGDKGRGQVMDITMPVQIRVYSLLFSILEMLLTGSDCFHVISDCTDSFSRDLHAFRVLLCFIKLILGNRYGPGIIP